MQETSLFKSRIIRITFITLLSISALFVSYKIYEMHQDKRMYEAHISEELYSDFNKSFINLVENDEVYKKVLQQGKLTYHDAYIIWQNNTYFSGFVQKYQRLALKFDKVENDPPKHRTIEDASTISDYFRLRLDGDLPSDKINNTLIEIDNNEKEKIEYLLALNRAWLIIAEDDIAGISINGDSISYDKNVFNWTYGKYRVEDNFWVEFIFNLDGSINYLENEIPNLEGYLWDK